MQKRREMPINIVKRTENSDLKYWLSKSPEERIDAVEFLRSQYYVLIGCKNIPRFSPNIQIRKINKNML